MTTQDYSIFTSIAAGITFLLSIAPLIYNKGIKGLKRITPIGYISTIITALIVWAGINTINANQKEKTINDSTSRLKDIKVDRLIDSLNSQGNLIREINYALSDKKLSLRKDKKGNITIVTNNYSNGTLICGIKIEIVAKPNKQKQLLCNGDSLIMQYVKNKDGFSFTIPYMKGKVYAGTFTISNVPLSNVIYDKNTGTFDISKSGVTGNIDNSVIEFTANLPMK